MWITQLFDYWSRQMFAPGTALRKKYQYFRDLLALDRFCLEKMAEIEEIHYRGIPCDYARVVRLCRELDHAAGNLAKSLIALNPLHYRELKAHYRRISAEINEIIEFEDPETAPPFSIDLKRAATRDPDRMPDTTLVGGKARNLAFIQSRDFPVPEGFCVTTRAFNAVLSANNLRPRINDILSRICLDSTESIEEKCRDIRRMLLEAVIPDDIRKELETRLEGFSGKKLAVRSSAVGEDGELSFAGQYKSLLHVDPEDFFDAYRQILAGKYTPRATAYRIQAGLPDELIPMAVLALEMIDGRESGVVYSSGIGNPEETGIYVVSGTGERLVGGEVKAKEYFIGKTEDAEFPADSPSYMKTLRRHALELEKLFGKPQDIEWVADVNDRLLLLQTRSLQSVSPDPEAPEIDLPVLAKGEWASPGRAGGEIFILKSKAAVSEIPSGSIVVCDGLYPELAAAAGRLGGVIAAEGSAASHFATIARESGVPVVINVPEATALFESGQMVTIDGHRGQIHDGKAKPSELHLAGRKTWLSEKMKEILKPVARLNLTDAASEDFVPENCRSMHDLIRFSHEMGVREMFALADRRGRGLYQSKVLELEIPLSFRVLNLEGGLTEKGDTLKRVFLKHVACKPFLAMFAGLAHENIEWDPDTIHFDWEEFDKMSAGIFNPTDSPLLSSYGLLARDYMHSMIRFGYHFAVVDALLVSQAEQNYIQFSFKGGGASESGKTMRLETIRIVLEKYGFTISVRGDMLNAEYRRQNPENTEKRLAVIGYILGRTRLMDMHMDEKNITSFAEAFSGEIDAIFVV